MTLAEEKQVQRKAGIAARRALAPETRAAANAALCARLAALPCFRQARTILLLRSLWRRGRSGHPGRDGPGPGQNAGLSRLQGKFQPDRGCARRGWLGGRPTASAPPILSRAEILPPEALDLILVPCTAFDAACGRVGMGKGYYDRYLPRCTRAVKLGIAFEAQRVPHAALDEHDQRLDAFITEGGVYRGTDKIEL